MLYIVATPIGNLADISARAIEVLQSVDLIASEDTRNAKKLLSHLNIQKPLFALHEHNEKQQATKLIAKLLAKQMVALITDAGTPLISDPGLPLVKLAHEYRIKIVPIPGPCALITALSVSGIAIDRFTFEGFLPAKINARLKHLQTLKLELRTMIFYEAPHRIVASLNDMITVFGKDRQIVLARELTKIFETIKAGSLIDILEFVTQNSQQQQGEIVLVLNGASDGTFRISDGLHENLSEAQRVLSILSAEMSLGQAARLAAKILGVNKKELYELGLQG